MSYARKISIGLAVLSITAVAEAQKPIVYPAKGQTTQQQSKDDAECYAWARQTTGIDPAVVASSPPPQETGPAVGGGQRVRGAVRSRAMPVLALESGRSWARWPVVGRRDNNKRRAINKPSPNSRK
jgi:hypothetical protein